MRFDLSRTGHIIEVIIILPIAAIFLVFVTIVGVMNEIFGYGLPWDHKNWRDQWK